MSQGGVPEHQILRGTYEQKKAQLALKVRQKPQDYGLSNARPTERTIEEIIQTDEELSAIREQLQQLEHKQRPTRRRIRINRDREPKTTDSKLMEKLYEAEEECANADIEVQVRQETLDTYRILTVILTGASQ